MNKIVVEPEGLTPLEPEEMEGLLHKHVTTRGELDELEQFNIQEGLRWLKRQKNPVIFNANFACKLHEKLFGQVWSWAGKFRQTEKNIGIEPFQIPEQLAQFLANAEHWVEHSIFPAKEIAARFHHKLVYIHPFPNGNGRHARIFADTVLIVALKEKPIDWAGGYDLQKMSDRRTEYIAALREADNGDFERLFSFVS